MSEKKEMQKTVDKEKKPDTPKNFNVEFSEEFIKVKEFYDNRLWIWHWFMISNKTEKTDISFYNI